MNAFPLLQDVLNILIDYSTIQMILILGSVFIYGVFTSYALYIYCVIPNQQLGSQVVLHVSLLIFYNIHALLAIRAGSELKRKVSAVFVCVCVWNISEKNLLRLDIVSSAEIGKRNGHNQS